MDSRLKRSRDAFLKKRPDFFLLVALLSIAACTQKPAAPLDPAQALIQSGKTTYRAVCIACHNIDPKQPGVLGPDVYGSSLELIEARVLHASYPPGYKPKRDSRAMPAFPQYASQIPALHAYLNAAP